MSLQPRNVAIIAAWQRHPTHIFHKSPFDEILRVLHPSCVQAPPRISTLRAVFLMRRHYCFLNERIRVLLLCGLTRSRRGFRANLGGGTT